MENKTEVLRRKADKCLRLYKKTDRGDYYEAYMDYLRTIACLKKAIFYNQMAEDLYNEVHTRAKETNFKKMT